MKTVEKNHEIKKIKKNNFFFTKEKKQKGLSHEK